ncbi:hypothetical protein Anapl_01980 [Anas platyrhynchos]|uniref:Uncharacterized protein n=1 Tax=Anas platyrhynchos TaxID=8839 RepID=R0KCB9_ANAPL|nr:hypothetical protein Anapl_01980 [Anas platyrhynchos]
MLNADMECKLQVQPRDSTARESTKSWQALLQSSRRQLNDILIMINITGEKFEANLPVSQTTAGTCQKQLKEPPDVASTGQQPGDSSVPQEGTCLHGACYLISREPAAMFSPRRASQYLPSRFKVPFFSSRLQKNKEHFVGTKPSL